MKLWVIRFNGIWPVGAVAVVQAPEETMALERFRTYWHQKNPTHDPEPVTAEPLKFSYNSVNVLLDGNY